MRPIFATTVAAVVAWGCSGMPSPRTPERTSAVAAEPNGCRDPEPGAAARFADANLERVVRGALELGLDEPLTCDAVATITALHAPDARIADLTGIAALVSLEELYIYGNNAVVDVTPLIGLPSLRDLNLSRNRIEDIGPLAEIGTLTSLSLYGNPISDITPLAALTGLTRLRVEHSAGVSDLTPLGGLTRLTRLELAGNDIVDVTPLSDLVGLTRLSLQDNGDLVDLGPLRHLDRLEILSLGGTSVTDLTPLAGLGQLTALGLEGTPLRDLGALIGLTHLSRLDLRGNRELTDIQPLLFNTGLGGGDAVRLERSGVSCEAISALRQKGVTVLASCR